jgi:predicted acetyltransferase
VERNPRIANLDLEVLHAASEQSNTLANLFQLYAYDFSDFHDVEIGEDGRFAFEKLSLFWSEPGRYAFLLRKAQKLAGFALVKKGSDVAKAENVWDMAEFFVLRRYRRNGVGTEAARQIWSRFPGAWEIRVMEDNHGAYQFWAHAVKTALGQDVSSVQVEMGSRCWHVFSFDSPSPAEETISSD